MDVEENEISVIIIFLKNLYANLTILKQTKSLLLKETSIWKISLLIFYQVRIGSAQLKKLKKGKQNIG